MIWHRLDKKQKVLNRLVAAGEDFGSPMYLYEETLIRQQCRKLLRMPNAFGLTVRYAMKANPNRTLLRIITEAGLHLDVSSINEARRARMAGIPFAKMMLTSQDVPRGHDLADLEIMLQQGLRYNICSERQLENILSLDRPARFDLSVRVHHGQGSGDSDSRNTAAPYASFGIVLEDLPKIKRMMLDHGVEVNCVHGHIGSGSDPSVWGTHTRAMLNVVDRFFPEAQTLNLGGGFKVARMPGENEADIRQLGEETERLFIEFAGRTGRRLHLEIEPGSYVMANSGMLITQILDVKYNHQSGLTFAITDGGIDSNVRPLLYGAQHPFALLDHNGQLVWREGDALSQSLISCAVVGRCCETGDCQTLDAQGRVSPRSMAKPMVGGWLLVGGIGAYSTTMSPSHYNSYLQPAEILLTEDGDLFQIRRKQTLEQLVANEWAMTPAA